MGSSSIVRPFGDIVVILGIKNKYSTLAYPQGNDQVEATNKAIMDGLKKRLKEAKGKWVDKLPYVLWTYCMMPEDPLEKLLFP